MERHATGLPSLHWSRGRWILSTLLAGVGVSLLAVAPASALGSTPRGITIGPSSPQPPDMEWFTYQLKPGERVVDSVLVTNATAIKQRLRLAAVDYEPTTIGAFGLKAATAEQTGIGAWVQLSTTTISLPPGQGLVVEFTLTIPPDADGGEQAGAITAQPALAAPSAQGSGSGMATPVSVRIYNLVPGTLIKKVALAGFSVSENTETGHYEFVVRGKNEGNVSVLPRLRLRLDGWGLVPVPPEGAVERADRPGLSLFGLQRFLPQEQANHWQLARGATVETYFRWRKPWFGRFRAQVTLAYERQPGQPETLPSAVYTFTVLPWPFSAYALGGLTLLVAVIVAWVLWRRVQSSGRAWHRYTVKAGDTLPVVAARCQLSWKRLVLVNKLKKPYGIKAGDKILVPPGAKLVVDKVSEKAAHAGGRPAAVKTTAAKRRGGVPRWLPLAVIGIGGTFGLALALFLALPTVVPPPAKVLPTPPAPPPRPAATLPAATAATSTEPLPTAPSTATSTPAAVPAQDTMTISVLNGSGIAGLAGRVVGELRQGGYRRLAAGNADAYTYQGATIRYRTGLRGAAEDIRAKLGQRYLPFTLDEVATSTAGVDMTIILGRPAAP